MPPAFACPVSTTAGRSVICVAGEVDIATAPVLQDAMLSAIGDAPIELTVDLGGVTFLDSSGAQALMTARARAEVAGVPFLLAAVPARTDLVLRVLGAVELFVISPEPDSVCRASA